jgi:phosphoribosylformimino-5-aminoimidazole carboxamide ribotide isomerase
LTPHDQPTLFPAIDLRGGRCVRLEQGEADRQTVYDTDPVGMAQRFAEAGATWIHVVDLDAAFGEGSNRAVIREVARSAGVRVQTGGGLRSEADLADVLEGGVTRAVIGTAAIENPDLVASAIRRWGPDRIAIGLDARGTRPAVRGWREDSGEDLFAIADRLSALGARTFIYTDISRDGMFSGPNVDTAVALAERTGADVIVSGGVGTAAHLDDVRRAAATHSGIAGVIVGKAIYEGHFTVSQALARLAG